MARFTNDFLPAIQIRWKLRLAVIPLLAIRSQQAVVPCKKFCSYHCIWIEMRVKRNLHRIWIAMEKTLVKRDQSIYSVQPRGVSGAVYCAVRNHQCHREHWGRRGWSDHHIATRWVTICAYETTIADAFQNHKNCYIVNQIWKWGADRNMKISDKLSSQISNCP